MNEGMNSEISDCARTLPDYLFRCCFIDGEGDARLRSQDPQLLLCNFAYFSLGQRGGVFGYY